MFYTAFSTFITAKSLYNFTLELILRQLFTIPLKKPSSTAPTSFYKDLLLLKPNNYAEINRHLYTKGFKQAITTEIAAL